MSYQQWTTYTQSPLATEDWPYQAIYVSGGNTFLAMALDVIYMNSLETAATFDRNYKRSQWNGSDWNAPIDRTAGSPAITDWRQANQNILKSDKATIHFAKTTSDGATYQPRHSGAAGLMMF